MALKVEVLELFSLGRGKTREEKKSGTAENCSKQKSDHYVINSMHFTDQPLNKIRFPLTHSDLPSVSTSKLRNGEN